MRNEARNSVGYNRYTIDRATCTTPTARAFIRQCIDQVRAHRPGEQAIEVRMNSAFCNDEILSELESIGVPYTVSVLFERFADLKGMIANRTPDDWQEIDTDRGAFERRWQPAFWDLKRHFVFVRQRSHVQCRPPPAAGSVRAARRLPRVQGGGDGQALPDGRAGALPRGARIAGGALRRTQERERAGLRADQHLVGQPGVPVGGG